MKYKLINSVSKKETICDKVVVDGWDYYVSDEKPTGYCLVNGGLGRIGIDLIQEKVEYSISPKKVIATTNPSIDLPKVMDEVEKYSEEFVSDIVNPMVKKGFKLCFTEGYNKSQETHPFSEEDMIEFAEWLKETTSSIAYEDESCPRLYKKSTKELLQLWREQKPKIVYYND